MSTPLLGPEPLAAHHDWSAFDCGSQALNVFLARFALVSQSGGAARTYVALRGARVAGYYSLAAASVEPERATPRVIKGLARHAVPLTLLARLAVDRSEQGAGLGEALLKDAIKRHLQAQSIIGSRALLAHAKDERAAAFYTRYGFQPSPSDPLHLYLLTKDMKTTLGVR
ncbi:MAG: GNAT family N-acetyltransferase [Betaproteobacteria bacterium]|nr:GNAT family N-acetyltransferase [Betaproteobacteria bacterium]